MGKEGGSIHHYNLSRPSSNIDSVTNIEIYELFKNHKPPFQTKPNFDAVADEVIDKLELLKSSKS